MTIERPWTAVAAPARGGFAGAAAGSLLAHAGLLAALIAAAPAAPHGDEAFVVEAEIVEAPTLRPQDAEPPAPLAIDVAALATPAQEAEATRTEPATAEAADLTTPADGPRETARDEPVPPPATTAETVEAPAEPAPALREIALAPATIAPGPSTVPQTPAAPEAPPEPPPAMAPPPAPPAAATPARIDRPARPSATAPRQPERAARARAEARPREASPRRHAALPAPGSAAPTARGAPPPRPLAPPAGSGGGADVSAWRAQVAARIAAMKRYPAAARERGDTGRPVVAFSLTRAGGLAGVALARASGHAELDAETLAMVRRAAPFPKPPPGAPLAFSLAVSFALR